MSLSSLAADVDDILHPIEQQDVLLLYAVVADTIRPYLDDRELASKIHLQNGPALIKRGSDLPPLTADRLAGAVDEEFLRTRNGAEGLDDVRDRLSAEQATVWQYFLPRKLCEFHYATNREGEGNPIDRVVFDIDRGEDVGIEPAVDVTRAFVEFLADDSATQELTRSMLISHTGYSFHVELELTEPRPPSFYREVLYTTEREELDTITDRGVAAAADAVDIPVVGGHEKQAETVTIDPSQTPSGKLNRVPLGSLHVADAATIDGVSVPISREALFDADIADRLRAGSPQQVIERLDEFTAHLP